MRIQRDRGFDFAAPGVEVALADFRQTQSEMGKRIGGVERDRAFESGLRFVRFELEASAAEAEALLGATQARCRSTGFLRGD